jgi:hypothetical protein
MTTPPEIWTEETLLRKARVYVERASTVEPGTGLEQLWSLIGLELLARAAVARVHPALLADPQDGAHLLYAFGFGEPKPPRSVPIATVFRRCQVIVPSFTEQMRNDGIALMTLRNEELHTGGLVLETVRPSTWQPQYYALCDALLQHLDLSFEEFFPPERAAAARVVLSGLAEDVESAVKQRIADKARWFAALPQDEHAERRKLQVGGPASRRTPAARERTVACPSCRSCAIIGGETAGVSEPRVGEDEIERDIRILPTRFRCDVCELPLEGHAELHHAGLGDEYAVVDTEDPLEYYGIDPIDYVSAEDFFEPDYGND